MSVLPIMEGGVKISNLAVKRIRNILRSHSILMTILKYNLGVFGRHFVFVAQNTLLLILDHSPLQVFHV